MKWFCWLRMHWAVDHAVAAVAPFVGAWRCKHCDAPVRFPRAAPKQDREA